MELVEQAVDIALEKKDPRQRFERRRNRRAKQEAGSARATDVDAGRPLTSPPDQTDTSPPDSAMRFFIALSTALNS